MRASPILAAGLALCPVLAAATPVTTEGHSVELRHRAFRQWSIDLPREKWFAVSGGIAIPHAGGDGFAAALEGTDLRVDTDGDGVLDRTIRATAADDGTKRARVVLAGERADGTPFTYGVRLENRGTGWKWAPGGAMVGTLETGDGAAQIRVIDRNGNGRFDDIGEDAMVVGRGNVATYLSRSVSLGGRLWELEVSPGGTDIDLAPFDGPVARLDMTTGFDTQARLLAAVVRSTDKAHSFDLAPFDGPIEVPAGDYEIVTGVIGLGKQTVRIAAGQAGPIALAHGAETTFDWGGPVKAEFQYMRRGEDVIFHPDAIWYYGAAGEQYEHWNPIGKSPVFTIHDRATGNVLEVLILPGSC